ncbi:dolichol kinase EVAN isoform X4 [Magnolia sinica]|uniref:dolichol kinase EVAN isoform X4 n=1 Tax=Magnolia sinica TaxID=86752 RepID=UPI00265AC6C4|nr:dolichol kinase EVAN isoform X4 [Magnolia sinica]
MAFSLCNGERAVVVLYISRVMFSSLPSSLFFYESIGLLLLAFAGLFVEISAEYSNALDRFKTRPGASSGILLGTVTLPTVMLSRLIQLSRALSEHAIEPEELEFLNVQYWAVSASCFGVLVLLYAVIWHSATSSSHSGSVQDSLCTLLYLVLYAAVCYMSLSSKSYSGWHIWTKLLWIVCHGLASLILIQHIFHTFPLCTSIGEALLVTGGLVFYFGDMLAFTLAKINEYALSSKLTTIQLGIRRSEISTISQGVLLGLLLLPIFYKFVLRIWLHFTRLINHGAHAAEGMTCEGIGRSILFYASMAVTLIIIVPTWMQFVQDFHGHPVLWQVWRVWPLGHLVHQFMNAFTDHRDSDILIVSHFSLLLGCALPKWLSSGFNDRPLTPFAGILSLGIGDTMASMVGHKYGILRWSKTGKKTVEGTAAGITSVLVACSVLVPLLASTGFILSQHWLSLLIAVTISGMLEAYTAQLDNAFIPLVFYSLLCL